MHAICLAELRRILEVLNARNCTLKDLPNNLHISRRITQCSVNILSAMTRRLCACTCQLTPILYVREQNISPKKKSRNSTGYSPEKKSRH